MKKVLIFSLNYYPRFIGGAEVAIKEITERIPHHEVEFHMVTLHIDSSLPRLERIGNVWVHRIGFAKLHPTIEALGRLPLHLNKYYFQIGAYFAAKTLHKKFHYDAVWAMMAHSCAIPAGLFKRTFPEIPYLLTLQEGDPPEYIEKKMRPVWRLFRQGFLRADALQTISTFLLGWGRRMGFAGDATVIPNGVNVAHFSQAFSPEDSERMRQSLGKEEGDVFLVTTSRLVHKNAVDDVIRALTLLPKNIHFIIYGVGPDEAMLRVLASTLGVEHRAHFMGELSHAKMPLALSLCDIFIRPSRSEGMGNSFIEAMAAGLPVIATQVGGLEDFLFDEVRNPDKETTGWAVDPQAPAQIVEAVKDIVTRADKVASVTAAAKALVRTTYDWDIVAKRMRHEAFELVFTRSDG